MINEATSDEAKQKFRKLVKMFHPDSGKLGDDSKMKHLNNISNDDTKIIDFYNEIMNPKKEEPKKETPEEEPKREKPEEEPKSNRRSSDSAYGYQGYSPTNKSAGKQKWEKRVKKFRKVFKKEEKKYGDYRDSDIFSGQTVKRRR